MADPLSPQMMRPDYGRPEFGLDRNHRWIDSAMVAVVFASILFNLTIGPLTVLLVAGMVGAFVLLRWERLPGVLQDCWPLLLIPLFAMLSALWSDVPLTTLRYGLLYLITCIAGILIGAGLRRDAYVNGYFIAFATYSIAAVLFGRMVAWGDGAGDAFAGLAGSKNTAGDMAGVATMATLVFAAYMYSKHRRVLAITALGLLPLLAGILWFSRATGALIASVMAATFVVMWIASRAFPRQARGGVFIGVSAVTIIAVLTQQWWLGPVFDLVLEASGKDAGLTGRAELWKFGNRLIEEKPGLGLGYYAFWLQDSLDAQYLWNMMGIASRQGFNFHSTPMEILIHLGWAGLIFCLLIFLASSASLIWRSIDKPYFSSILACGLLAFFAVKMPFEVVGFSPMHFSTVTLFAILAMGLRRDRWMQQSGAVRPRSWRLKHKGSSG